MNNYIFVQKPYRLDDNFINNMKTYVLNNPNYIYVINYKTTQELSLYDLYKLESSLSNRVQIRIEGGYDDHRINSYRSSTYVNMHSYDNIYTFAEMKKIMVEIQKIEDGINPNWSPEQKLVYFIGTLKNKIIYHPFHENAPSKDIRSLRGLFSHNTVCAGYAVILKELCDRNGIECQYVEGCTTKEDFNRGVLTHAWNIVKINENYFPLDLTWNASKSASGKTLSIFDIANVNEFVKSHIPGRYEAIQDYKGVLKSLDGSYLTAINNLVNKDMTYELSTVYIKRNGKTIYITQVEEFIVENKSVYKYIYNVEDENGKLRNPHMFYSGTNILHIVRACRRKEKTEKQLEQAKKNGNKAEVARLTKALVGNEYLEDANDLIDNLLFSRENLIAADRRGDNYVGEVKVERDQDGHSRVDGVIIDPIFAKKIAKKHRNFRRSDGTSFVIEDFGTLDLGNNIKVYRYKMFENIKTPNGLITKKNTIFTDNDIMNDNRQLLADDFLSRSRIDRKTKETSGYLGHYSSNNIRTYDIGITRLFNDGIYRHYQMKSKHVRDYVPELTFDDMKRMVQVYSQEIVNGRLEVVNRRTKKVISDPVLKKHIEFSLVWLKAAGTKVMGDDVVPGYYYAFKVEDAEKVFTEISKVIRDSIHKSGNIDPIEILRQVSEKHGLYKYAELIVMRLFNTKENVQIVNSFYRMQNPSSVREKTTIQPVVADYETMAKLSARRRQLEEEKKQLLEVIENNGKVEIVPARRK